jgi:hypothetical protein
MVRLQVWHREEVADDADEVDGERDEELEERLLPEHRPPGNEVKQPQAPCASRAPVMQQRGAQRSHMTQSVYIRGKRLAGIRAMAWGVPATIATGNDAPALSAFSVNTIKRTCQS